MSRRTGPKLGATRGVPAPGEHKKPPKRLERPIHRHSKYGDIPLVRHRDADSAGREYEVWICDPDFKPPMPRGAVRADVRRQTDSRRGVPQYYYEDRDQRCVDCGDAFVFSAKEQKFGYETLGLSLESVANRCLDCRRRNRQIKRRSQQIGDALAGMESEPDDPLHALALAEASVRFRELTGQGDLDRAIAAARRAAKERPTLFEALFWEAKCHLLAGREDTARELFERFAASARSRRRDRALVVETDEILAKLSP